MILDLPDARPICHCARHGIGPHWHDLVAGCPALAVAADNDHNRITVTLTRKQWRDIRTVLDGVHEGPLAALRDELNARKLGDDEVQRRGGAA